MKMPFFALLALGMIAAAIVMQPGGSRLHAESDAEIRASAAIVQDLLTQQKTIAENQAQIDEKLAAIGEQLRVARIFESRAGGMHKAP